MIQQTFETSRQADLELIIWIYIIYTYIRRARVFLISEKKIRRKMYTCYCNNTKYLIIST